MVMIGVLPAERDDAFEDSVSPRNEHVLDARMVRAYLEWVNTTVNVKERSVGGMGKEDMAQYHECKDERSCSAEDYLITGTGCRTAGGKR